MGEEGIEDDTNAICPCVCKCRVVQDVHRIASRDAVVYGVCYNGNQVIATIIVTALILPCLVTGSDCYSGILLAAICCSVDLGRWEGLVVVCEAGSGRRGCRRTTCNRISRRSTRLTPNVFRKSSIFMVDAMNLRIRLLVGNDTAKCSSKSRSSNYESNSNYHYGIR